MIEKFSIRLKRMLDIRNMKAVDLAEKTGIGKSSISFYLNDKCLPKQQRLFQISKALNCNPAFLMGIADEPNVENKKTDNLSKTINRDIVLNISADEAELLTKYRQLDIDEREEVKAIIEMKVAKAHKKLAEKEGLA